MPKSFLSEKQMLKRYTKERLLDYMKREQVSLLKACRHLDIPYKVARQIIFTHSSNKTIAKVMSLTDAVSSPVNRDNKDSLAR